MESTYQRDKEALHYLKKVSGTIGFGFPTLCAYQYLSKSSMSLFNHNEVYYYFVMDGILCCARIRNLMGILFYGHAYGHSSSVCVIVINDLCYFFYDGFKIVGWGVSKATGEQNKNGSGKRAQRKRKKG
jgi:hypothetical protein